MLIACTSAPSPLADCEVARTYNGYEYDQRWTYDESGHLVETWVQYPGTRTTYVNELDGRPAIEEMDIGDDGSLDVRTVWYYGAGNRAERMETDLDLDGFRDEYIGYEYDGRGRLLIESWYGVTDAVLAARTAYEYDGDLLIAKTEDGNGDGIVEIEERWTYGADDLVTLHEREKLSLECTDRWVYTYEQGMENGGWIERITEERCDEWSQPWAKVTGYNRHGEPQWVEVEDTQGMPWQRDVYVYDPLGRPTMVTTDWGLDDSIDNFVAWEYACDGSDVRDPAEIQDDVWPDWD